MTHILKLFVSFIWNLAFLSNLIFLLFQILRMKLSNLIIIINTSILRKLIIIEIQLFLKFWKNFFGFIHKVFFNLRDSSSTCSFGWSISQTPHIILRLFCHYRLLWDYLRSNSSSFFHEQTSLVLINFLIEIKNIRSLGVTSLLLLRRNRQNSFHFRWFHCLNFCYL